MMALMILSYGIHCEDNDNLFKTNQSLIDFILESEKHLNWKDRLICTIGGGNWDKSYLIGVPIKAIDYTSISLNEIEKLKNKENWLQLFNNRLSKFPDFEKVLKQYQSHIDYQIICDNE
jgi:hypothetical protein